MEKKKGYGGWRQDDALATFALVLDHGVSGWRVVDRHAPDVLDPEDAAG
jgi:hypothetical protein